MKLRRGYCRRHPRVKLPASRIKQNWKTNCCRCKAESFQRSRNSRAIVWDNIKTRPYCVNHPKRFCNRSLFLHTGGRRCASCRAKSNGKKRPSYLRTKLRWRNKSIKTGHQRVYELRCLLRKRLAERAW